jgi:hypothetical protein
MILVEKATGIGTGAYTVRDNRSDSCPTGEWEAERCPATQLSLGVWERPDFREGYLDANTFADGGNEHVCGARPGGSESHNKGTKAQATKSIAAVPKRHKHKATEGAIYERST